MTFFRAGWVIGILCGAVGTMTAGRANAQDLSQFFEGFSGSKTNYEAPKGRYHMQVPGGLIMQVDEDNPDPNMVIFAGEMKAGTRAQLVVKKVEVTPGAASSQLMLTTRDNHLVKLANFTVEQIRKTHIANRICTVLRGRYDFQGNKAYPMAIEQAYLIDGSEGFVIGMEVPYDAQADMWERMRQVYQSFVPVRPRAEPVEVPPAAKTDPPPAPKNRESDPRSCALPAKIAKRSIRFPMSGCKIASFVCAARNAAPRSPFAARRQPRCRRPSPR